MTYNFVEMNYPTNNPNTDLDFGNNIMYTDLVDDDIDTHNVAYDTKNVVPAKNNKNRKIIKYRQKPTRNIYILFICVISMLLVFWYVKRDNNNTKKNILDNYVSESNLISLKLRRNF